jgi:hypothetical protein
VASIDRKHVGGGENTTASFGTMRHDVPVAEVNWHDGNDHISLPVSPVDGSQSSIFQLQKPCQQEEKSPSMHLEPPIEVKPTPKLPNVTQSTCTQGVLQPPLHDGRDDLAGGAMEDREECTTQLPTPAEKGHASNQEHQDEDDAAHDAKAHPGVCQSRQLVQSSTGGSSLQHPTSPLGARNPIIADGGSQVEMQPFSLESAVLSLRQENWVNGTALTHTLNTFNPPHSRYHIVEAGWVDPSLTKHAIRRYRPNLSSLDAMIVPLCHSQSHWTIGIVHLRSGQLEIYDPLNSQKTLDASARALGAFAQGLGSEQSWEVQASEVSLYSIYGYDQRLTSLLVSFGSRRFFILRYICGRVRPLPHDWQRFANKVIITISMEARIRNGHLPRPDHTTGVGSRDARSIYYWFNSKQSARRRR